MRKKFSWTNTLELGAENVPQQTKSKVEEHNVASEFRSDAQFPRKSLYEHQYTSLFFVTTSNHYIEFQKRFSAKAVGQHFKTLHCTPLFIFRRIFISIFYIHHYYFNWPKTQYLNILENILKVASGTCTMSCGTPCGVTILVKNH